MTVVEFTGLSGCSRRLPSLDKDVIFAHNGRYFRNSMNTEVGLMRAVITVIGKDMVGILAHVTTICAENQVNVLEVTQSILQDLFAMIMLVDISKCSIPYSELSDRLTDVGNEMNLTIHIMREDIFNSMHRI
jgi:ACT domain-containing protein